MSDKNLVRALHAVHALDVQQAPKQHRLKTPQCPSLPHFAVALQQGWTPEEGAHVTGCAYCQTITAMEWRMACPGLLTLVLHLAGASYNVQAMQHHLEDDACRRCQRLLQSRWLHALAQMILTGQRTLAHVQALVDATVATFAPLQALVGAFAPTTRRPFQARAVHPDGSLTVTLREATDGNLVVHVETPDPGKSGQKVRVEVVGEGEPLVAEVILEAQGAYGCAGLHIFGVFAELAPRLGADCAVLATLIEADASQ